MKEKLQKNWKNIVIVLLAFFSLNKCTQSCNRSQTITKHELAIDSLSNVISDREKDIDSMAHKIDLLENDIKYTSQENDNLKNSNKELSDIAKKTQQVKVIRVDK